MGRRAEPLGMVGVPACSTHHHWNLKILVGEVYLAKAQMAEKKQAGVCL